MFRKLLDQGQAGDNIGALIRGVNRDGVERGQILCKPGSVKPHKKFKAEAYILTKEEGGRHTPFFTNYRPQFYFRTTDVTGIVTLPEGTEMVMPGDNVTVDVELILPIAMEEKLRFAIREGGRTVERRYRCIDRRVIFALAWIEEAPLETAGLLRCTIVDVQTSNQHRYGSSVRQVLQDLAEFWMNMQVADDIKIQARAGRPVLAGILEVEAA